MATGKHGVLHAPAVSKYRKLFGREPTEVEEKAFIKKWLSAARDTTGKLEITGDLQPYGDNPFGRWSWRLHRQGKETEFFIHTSAESNDPLAESHGCIHVLPKDRDRWMEKQFLRAGVKITVKNYHDIPPYYGANEKLGQ